jgi:ABC-2 type transport system ATP-binding protein
MADISKKTNSEVALSINSLTKDYTSGFWQKKKRAVDNLNLTISSGEIFGYLGTNGAGKTTTIKVLVGIMTPTSGGAEIFGQSICSYQTRYQVGFLPEQPYFYEYLTAFESLKFYYSLSGNPVKNVKKKIEEKLDLLGLADVKDVRLREYSKGMRQRLGIAQAIIHDPKIVFLDEPLSGLDPVGRNLIRNIIFQMKDLGMTVFFSSHILSDVEMICDRIGLLRKGKLVNCGYLTEILSAKTEKNEFTIKHLPSESLETLEKFSDRIKIEGDFIRAIVSEGEKSRMVFNILRTSSATLISLVPQKETLEDYFIRTETDSMNSDEAELNRGNTYHE